MNSVMIKIFKVLKEKRPEDEEIDKKLEDGLKNKDINEPFNQEAVQEEYKPTRQCIQVSISK